MKTLRDLQFLQDFQNHKSVNFETFKSKNLKEKYWKFKNSNWKNIEEYNFVKRMNLKILFIANITRTEFCSDCGGDLEARIRPRIYIHPHVPTNKMIRHKCQKIIPLIGESKFRFEAVSYFK